MPKKTRQCNLKHIFIAAQGRFPLSFDVLKFGNFLKYWLPAIIWMALIFSGSGDSKSQYHTSTLFMPLLHWFFPHIPDDEAERLHHYFRKCGHFTEYAILALLIRRTLVHGLKTSFPVWSWRLVGSVIGLVFLYASSDEFHQSFVPHRTPLFSDVCIDTAGGSAGLLFFWLCLRVLKKC